MVVQHQESLILTRNEITGADGEPLPREQDGPEQGNSRRGPAGAGFAWSVAEYLNSSMSASDARADRITFDVTS
jgi:hypothetical protein